MWQDAWDHMDAADREGIDSATRQKLKDYGVNLRSKYKGPKRLDLPDVEPIRPEDEEAIARSGLEENQKAAVRDYLSGTDGYREVGERHGVTGQTILNWGRKVFNDTAWKRLEAERQSRAEARGERRPDRHRGKPGAAEKAAQEAKEGHWVFSDLPIPKSDPGRTRADAIGGTPDVVKADRPEVEARLSGARGLKRPSLLARAKQYAANAWHRVTRPQIHLPNTPEFASDQEAFRQLNNFPNVVADQTARSIAGIVDQLGPQQLALFERALIVQNQLAALERSEPLRFGFKDKAEVEAYKKKLDALVAATPEVQQALQTREAIRKYLVGEAVKAKLLPEAALDNDAYYHQQVLGLMDGAGKVGSGAAVPLQYKRAFQKARVTDIESLDEKFDYNTSYIEAEARWMSDMLSSLAKERWLDRFIEPGNTHDALKRQAKDKNWENLVGGPENVARIWELRGRLAELRESEDAADSATRQEMAQLSEELSKLDPTVPFRQRIAIGMRRLGKAGVDTDAIESDQFFRELDDIIDKAPDSDAAIAAKMIYKAIGDRNAFIKEKLGRDFLTWEKLVPDTHEVWSPEPGNLFFRATTVPERIVEAVTAGVLKEAKVSADDLKTALVLGGQRRPMVIKKELVAQLKDTLAPAPGGPLSQLSRNLMGMWKSYTLFNPKRMVGYLFRNTTGDLEPVLAAAPGMVKEIKAAYAEVSAYHSGKQTEMSVDLKDARDLGVIGSGITKTEIPDLKDVPILRRFGDKPNLVSRYYEWAKRINSIREDTLRYAAYLYYKGKLERGEPFHYGAAKKSTVDALLKEQGVTMAAGHLARNLLGDYGNLTHFGNWMRQHAAPFWSWVEVNFKRWPRLTENAVRAGLTKDTAISAGALTAINLIRLGGLYAAVYTWNNTVMRDAEEKLSPQERARLHITLGMNDDGTVRKFDRVGSLSDLADWFGVEEILAAPPQATAGDIAGDVGKNLLNKLVQSGRPDIKSAAEVFTGQSFFPDVTRPRPTPRDELATAPLGLTDELKFLKGKLGRTGDVPKPGYARRLLGTADTHPGRAALSEVHDLRRRFLEAEGRPQLGRSFGRSSVAKMQDALNADNFEAFKDAKAAYLADKGNEKKFRDALDKFDPLAERVSDKLERKFEREYLTDEQRKKLGVARNYAKDQKAKMLEWWRRAK
jgi:hypothetical protein